MVLQAGKDSASQAVSLTNEAGKFPALMVCEHASNLIPKEYADLGLEGEILSSHIAWDPGAGKVAKALSRLFDAPLVSGEISRLVYDCNRPPHARDAIPETSEVHEIPGNRDLGSAERQARITHVYEPFRKALATAAEKLGPEGALITIHSFTPVYRGEKRSVEIGILHDDDSHLADLVLNLAPTYTSLTVRRNEPYGPQDGVMHTLKVHGVANNIPNVMIEIRNDLIANQAMQEDMASMLHALLGEAIALMGQNQSQRRRSQ